MDRLSLMLSAAIMEMYFDLTSMPIFSALTLDMFEFELSFYCCYCCLNVLDVNAE